MCAHEDLLESRAAFLKSMHVVFCCCILCGKLSDGELSINELSEHRHDRLQRGPQAVKLEFQVEREPLTPSLAVLFICRVAASPLTGCSSFGQFAKIRGSFNRSVELKFTHSV